jgi:hypothetical protein
MATKNGSTKKAAAAKSRLPKDDSPTKGKIQVEMPPMARLTVLIEGISPLVVHRFSDKASKAIKDKHTSGKKVRSLEARVPKEEYEEAFHYLANGKPGFPASGLKGAIKTACADVDGIAMTQAKRLLWVPGQEAGTAGSGLLLEITKAKPRMREDMVRQPPRTGTFVPRWRPEFPPGWQIEVPIVIKDTNVLSPDSVVNLLARAGMQVGLGEGRPEKDGAMDFGMFRVAKVLNIETIGYEELGG